MKTKGLIRLLVGLTLAASGAFAVGSALSNQKAEAAEATVGSTGNIIIRKDDTDMRYTGSSLVAYFFNGSSNAWISPVANDGKQYQELKWSLSFTPTTVIVLRVDTANWSSNNPWSNVWSRTGNVTLTDTQVIWMKGSATQYNSDWGDFSCVATVKGGASDNWSTATVDKVLGEIKTDGDKIEVYDSVSFPANTYFKVLKGSDWYGNYTAHASILSNLSGGGSSNIHNAVAAEYEVYFNYESPSIYLTDPVTAAADEWAQDFLANVGCDPTGATAPSGWAGEITRFNSITDSRVKDKIYSATANKTGSYLEQAVYWYDYAIAAHPELTKFIKNSSNVVRASNYVVSVNPIIPVNGNTNTIAIIVIISLVSVTAIGGYFFIRKRKSI